MGKEHNPEGVTAPVDELEALPSCACGTTRESRAAIPDREYSTLGVVYLLWGGTARPTRVTFRCAHCGDRFDACTNRKELAAWVI
jgi:hypothetical protein